MIDFILKNPAISLCMGNLYGLSINSVLINLDVAKEADFFTKVVYFFSNSVFEIVCFFFVLYFLSFISPLPFITFLSQKQQLLFSQINFSGALII